MLWVLIRIASQHAFMENYRKLSFYIVWLGWAMVLGSFQCPGVLLLLHIVGQGPAVLAAGAGWVRFFFFLFFICLPFLMSCLLGNG